MDFLVHFLLLFCLSSAVHFIATGNLAAYFLASGLGSSSAACCLWLDHRLARKYGLRGPTGTAWILTIIAAVEFSMALVCYFGTLSATWVAALILPAILLELTSAFRSMRLWQQSLNAVDA